MKPSQIISLLTVMTIAACTGDGSDQNSGGINPNPDIKPDTSPLTAYFNSLNYLLPSASLPETKQGQLDFNFQQERVIDQLTVTFYSDSNCHTAIANFTLSGTTTCQAGHYLTTDHSNYFLCSNFNFHGQGCAYEALYTNSMRFTVHDHTTNQNLVQDCMQPPSAASAERIAVYIGNYSNNCMPNQACGFSHPYQFTLP